MRELLQALGAEPVLVDVGASIEPPRIWAPIAAASTYVGFDPDRREMTDRPEGGFRRSIMVNEAVTSEPNASEVRFHLTRTPSCSSTLAPDREALANYHFAGQFEVERETTVRAATLEAVLGRLGLARVDWLKCDSQGTDLRIFRSLAERTRANLLALDVEPGLIDAYRGEDLFAEAHLHLVRSGFWLSRLQVHGAVRGRAESLRLAFPGVRDPTPLAEGAIRRSPGWCEARYLRTLESLAEHGAAGDRTLLLAAFALLDEQPAFALDAALDYERRFGADERCARLRAEATAAIARGNGLVARAKRWLRGLAG